MSSSQAIQYTENLSSRASVKPLPLALTKLKGPETEDDANRTPPSGPPTDTTRKGALEMPENTFDTKVPSRQPSIVDMKPPQGASFRH